MDYTNVSAASAAEIEQIMESALIGGIAVVAVWLLALLFYMILFGVLCKKLAKKKGYRGYFWTGFFLGFIGLIYVVGLPVKKKIRAIEE